MGSCKPGAPVLALAWQLESDGRSTVTVDSDPGRGWLTGSLSEAPNDIRVENNHTKPLAARRALHGMRLYLLRLRLNTIKSLLKLNFESPY